MKIKRFENLNYKSEPLDLELDVRLKVPNLNKFRTEIFNQIKQLAEKLEILMIVPPTKDMIYLEIDHGFIYFEFQIIGEYVYLVAEDEDHDLEKSDFYQNLSTIEDVERLLKSLVLGQDINIDNLM